MGCSLYEHAGGMKREMRLLGTAITLLQLLALCTQLATGQAVTITTPPVDMDVARGDSFSLTCVAMGDQPVSISWEREGVLVGNGMMVGSDLVFGEALPDHAGVYECVARSGMIEDRAAATITVSYAPVFVSLGVEPGDEVINGTMVTFNCTMNGFPEPSVTWFHNGQEVMESGRVSISPDGLLIVASVQLSDAGLYSCNGSNSLGTLESDTSILLMVYYPPMNIVVHGSPPDLVVDVGGRVVVTCEASSVPQSHYVWWRQEEEEEGGRTEVQDTSHIMVFDGNRTLVFTMVQCEDAGRYYCTAGNGYGNISSDFFEIRVIALPMPPVGVATPMTTPYSVLVEWDTTIAFPTVVFYTVEYRLDDTEDRVWENSETASMFPTSLVVSGLLPYGRYQVRVSAVSPAGQGEPSETLIFMTETGVPLHSNTPLSEEVTSVGPRSITLFWTIHADIIFTSYTFTSIELSSPSTQSLIENAPGSGVHHQVTGLIPNTPYRVRLRLNFVGGYQGPAVQLKIRTMEDAPDSPPRNITAAMVTSTSALLSWRPPWLPNGNITSYTVTYYPTDSSSEEVVEEEGEESLVLTGLRPFTEYNVSVSASTAEGEGPEASILFTTLEEAPQPPNITTAHPISSTQLRLSWQLEGHVPGNLSGYNVTYVAVGGVAMETLIELGPNNESVVLNGLGVWSEYRVCVSAATVGGGPGNSSCVTLRTLPAAPVLELEIEAVIPRCPPSLLVSWKPVTSDLLPQLNGPAEDAEYVVMVEGEGGTTLPFDISTTEYIVPDLMLGSEYSVSLAVANSNGIGPVSNTTEASTPSAGAPPVPGLEVVPAETSLLVSWEASPNNSIYLSFTYEITVLAIDIVSTTSHNVTGLSPATGYSVSVRADGGCGFGDPVIMTTTTLEAKPGPPLVAIVTVSSSSVSLRVEEPVMANGIITHYMVVCGDEEEEVEELASGGPVYHVCSGLSEESVVEVTVWAVNGAGQGERVTVNTTTACKSGDTKVDVMSDVVTVELNSGCPTETHVLIVVQEAGGMPRPLSTYSIEELVESTLEYSNQRPAKQVATTTTVYIAANIKREDSFQLGDGMKYGDYINYKLKTGVKYVVGVVGVSRDPREPPVVMTTPGFKVPVEPEGTPVEPEGTSSSSDEIPVQLVGGAGGGIVLILLVAILLTLTTILCCRKRRRGNFNPDMQGKGSSHSFERGASVRISGRRGNRPTDPVEEYRANYHTEALEVHPPVPINGFINKLLVMRTNDNQLFLEEFGSIEMAPQQPCSVAELPSNRNKNRYHNILPYDHSRVKLSHSKNQTDYINTSYCSGFMKVQGFVATQGPLPDTVPDFWRMVWEQNSRTIVMLTNAQERMKTKCEVYWPREVGCSAVHNGIEVTLTDFTQLADYTIRSLTLCKAGSGKEVRDVRQFHFTSWPDHGVPQYATAMLAMVRRVQAFHTTDGGPMVVHCSAGVGRTGTFIVIYSMLERMKADRPTADIYGHVSLLRTQRNYMVQTEDQYFFIYEAVAEVIVCGDTEVPLEQLEEYVADILSVAHEVSDSTNIELQFKRLAVDKSDTYRFASANKDVNKAKNRYVNVLPYETRRVVLQYQRAQEGSDYINASFIDGYHYRNAFIATQGPLQNTLADFWRMVWEHNIPVIVILTKCHEKGTERSAQYWPQEVGQTLSCSHYSVEMTVERKSEHYTYRDLLLVDTQSGRKRQVRHFHYLSWPEVGVPSSPLVLVDFLREVQKNFATLNTKSPITVHCSNGIGRSGIFIALHIILERMVAEGLVDVFQTIKNLRIQRPAMVQTLEQYQFCYTAALDYLESSDLVNQLRSSTRSDSLRPASGELRSSRRSLNRNDSVRSSAKRSSRNLEMSNVSNGVAATTTVYGDSEATSTFGTSSQQQLTVPSPQPLEDQRQSEPVPLPPHLLANPHLAHLDPGSQLSQSSLPSAQGWEPSLAGSSSSSPLPSSLPSLMQTSTLPTRGSGGSSGPMQSHWAMAASSSQTSLTRPPPSQEGGAYPVSSFRGRGSGGQRSSQDSLEQQFAALTHNLNNSNNNVVDVFVEP